MTLVRALFVFAIVILPATSFAAPTAAIHVVSGDNVFDFLVVGSPNDVGTFTAILDVFESGFFNIDGDISSDADPFIQYSFGVQNFTASSQTFTFSFLEPIVGGPYTTLISSHASNVTDDGSGIVQVAPSGGTFIHRPQINGVETVGQLGDGCVVTVPSDACDGGFGNFPISSVSGPETLGVTVAFTLSAGDAYATTGRVEQSSTVNVVARSLPRRTHFIARRGVTGPASCFSMRVASQPSALDGVQWAQHGPDGLRDRFAQRRLDSLQGR